MALQVLRTFTDVEDERGAVLVGRGELLDRDLSHEVLRSVGSVVSLNTIYPYGYFTRLGIRLSQYPVGYSLTQAVPVPQGVHHVSSRHVRQCGKVTWAGCGQHVDQVMAGVPRDQQCTCAPEEKQ